jgi:hypothetical protein
VERIPILAAGLFLAFGLLGSSNAAPGSGKISLPQTEINELRLQLGYDASVAQSKCKAYLFDKVPVAFNVIAYGHNEGVVVHLWSYHLVSFSAGQAIYAIASSNAYNDSDGDRQFNFSVEQKASLLPNTWHNLPSGNINSIRWFGCDGKCNQDIYYRIQDRYATASFPADADILLACDRDKRACPCVATYVDNPA